MSAGFLNAPFPQLSLLCQKPVNSFQRSPYTHAAAKTLSAILYVPHNFQISAFMSPPYYLALFSQRTYFLCVWNDWRAYDSAMLSSHYTFSFFPQWPMNGKSINYHLYKALEIFSSSQFHSSVYSFLGSQYLLSHYFPLGISVYPLMQFLCLELSVLSLSAASTLSRHCFSITLGHSPWKT